MTTPRCSKDVGIKKGPWTPEEDEILANFVRKEGEGRWRTLPKRAGLHRCGKSCRLRWMNYLRPNVKRGHIALDEEDLILRLHRLLGNRWALIAGRIPGRTDNEIKNYWNTHISKKLIRQGIDPRTHKPLITNTNNTTTTTNTNAFLISSDIHESSNNSPIILPTRPQQPHLKGSLVNNSHYHHHHPALEIGSSSSNITPRTNNNNNSNVDEVIPTSGDDDGKLVLEEYHQNIKDQEGRNDDSNNNEDTTFMLFLNSLVNNDEEEEEEVVMSNNNNDSNNGFASSSSSCLPLSRLCYAQTRHHHAASFNTLADWEAEFSNALNGAGQYYYYGSSSPSSM